ncbi:hypothetical protein PYW07_007228 [Mythimna separata]|uniref:Reverse transcriptase domain-containing protein n=1 Tax=Mythimna separata TaxID=271217 RepID=A0AAD7Z1F4_MYTSE|nr:hypothetical protein PYW07_007228 [Mythimna separata]
MDYMERFLLENNITLDDDERPEHVGSPTGSMPDLTALQLGSEGDSQVTSVPELNPPELESANAGTRPIEMDSEMPSGSDLSFRKRNLSGAARKRLRRLKAGGMDPAEAYKLVTEQLANARAPSTGQMADMSKGKRPIKRIRSEDESPKDHAKKATRVDDGSGSIILVPDEPSTTQVGPPPETSAMSFKDALTNVRVGIRNKEPMSDAQLGLLYKDILRAILNAPMPKGPEFKIRTEGCTFKPGWLQVIVKNDYSRKWLEQIVGTLKPWPEAELSFINEKDLPKAKIGILHFRTEDVLKTPRDALNLLEKQNDLQTGLWKVLSVKKERDGITTALSIDDASVKALRMLNCRPQLGFHKAYIHIRGDNTLAKAEQVAGASQSGAKIPPPAQHAPKAGPSVQVSGKTAKQQNAKPKPGGRGTHTNTQVVQINLHHARAATAVLEKHFTQKNLHIALIQEPWLANTNTVSGLGSAGLCSDDLIAAYVNVKSGKGRLIVCSAYLDGTKNEPSEELAKVVEYACANNAELLIGCDANAHHTNWGSTDINDRGELLHDFVLTNRLQIVNEGCKPTFVTRSRKEVLDVTLATIHTARLISNWHVSDEPSMSDHRLIKFALNTSNIRETITFRDVKATDWDLYRRKLQERLQDFPKTIRSPETLDYAVAQATEAITASYEESCPLRTVRDRKVTWWNKKLDVLRGEARRLFNKAKSTDDWDRYRKALTTYNKEIRKAKRLSWRKFCEEITKVPQGARIHKVLSKSPTNQLGLLKKPDGTFTASAEETLNLLASTHFPGSVVAPDIIVQNTPHIRLSRPLNEDWRRAAKYFRPNNVEWAIDSFKPIKSAGYDDIFPALLQQGKTMLIPILIKIFRASFAWGYIPEKWTMVKVCFIPKAGKKDYSQPKSFRPISLTSFLLKSMEKVIDECIRDGPLRDNPLHPKQHAYQKGKSTETALLELTDRIERALEDKQIALCAFLDIEGAFDNVTIDALSKGMKAKGIDETTTRWIEFMLLNRTISVTLHGTTQSFKTTKGCPQGGVLSPLLWLLVVDQLLVEASKNDLDVHSYADDVVACVVGPCQSTVSSILQRSLNTINTWCTENHLSVNPSKTTIVPFTRKRKLDKLVTLTVKGTVVPLSSDVKYLGVTIDQRLTWNTHINNVIQKAKIALGICCRLAGTKWGLNPRIALWLYTAIVRPIITYACVVWWRKTTQVTVISKLDGLQRLACLISTGAMSTTPGAALNALLNLPPLHLFIAKEAKASIYRTNSTGRRKESQVRVTYLQTSLITQGKRPGDIRWRRSQPAQIMYARI